MRNKMPPHDRIALRRLRAKRQRWISKGRCQYCGKDPLLCGHKQSNVMSMADTESERKELLERRQHNADVTRGFNPKPTNPKDAVGSSRLPVDLVPDTMVVFASLGFLEGALKYGKYNWRVAGVQLSIYWAALERHRMKFCAGEWADIKTGVPHLSSMLASIAIIVDAYLAGKLNDDRPPALANLSSFIDSLSTNVEDLKRQFADHHPHQYTISDHGDDSGRKSEGEGGRPAEAVRGVLPEAGTKRNGRTRTRLPRNAPWVRVRH